MGKRNQRRQKAILPLKLVLSTDGKSFLAHTLDISASGARVVLNCALPVTTTVTIEFKRKRSSGVVVWCKPVKGSKYDHEVGLKLLDAGQSYWGIHMKLKELDLDANNGVDPISYDKVASLLTKQA